MYDSDQNRRWSRRDVLSAATLGLAAAAGLGLAGPARATPKDAAARIKDLVGGKQAEGSSLIDLDLPEIAENGNTVPVSVSVDSPMTADDYVKAVHVVAEKNPRPGVATFRFTPMSGRASASTRMRLAETQNVVAVAELSDGSVIRTTKEVKVTIGGCGG